MCGAVEVLLSWFLAAGLLLSGVTNYDGDTLRSNGVSYRVAMIDTPERPPRAKCWAELAMGIRARARVRDLIANAARVEAMPDNDNPGRRSVDDEGWPLDRHGRRLAHISVDGLDLGELLLTEGLAVRWDPGRVHNWC